MAELNLYGNKKEPTFPFDLVKDRLEWLKQLLSRAEENWDEWERFPDRLNIVLVFSRTRTSTIVEPQFLSEHTELINRLNSILRSVGAEHHTMAINLRGTGISRPAFITCKRSPRFNWRVRLSTLDVGKNLDYFAAGHCCGDRTEGRGTVRVIETQTSACFISEVVLLKYLHNPESWERFSQFNDAKIRTMNDAFTQLGLPYRCVWEFDRPSTRESFRNVMNQSNPPDEAWWRKNIRWVNQIHPLSINHYLYPVSNFSPDCDYRRRWPIITKLYVLSETYKRIPDSSNSNGIVHSLWSIFAEVDLLVNGTEFSGDPHEYAVELERKMEEIVSESTSALPKKPIGQPLRPERISHLRLWSQIIALRVDESKRRLRQGI